MDKLVPDPKKAVSDVGPGSSIAVGGFGLCGIPSLLIEALASHDAKDLTVISNNCGVDGIGLDLLLKGKQLRRVIASYVGQNKELERQFLAGELEVELVPQGTLAERLRAGGSGIAAFYTPTGVGTLVADGGIPLRYAPDGSVALASAPREVREFRGRKYVLEEAITCDFALVRAAKCDRLGNLVFHGAARNFNPVCAMSATVTIAEAEQVLGTGEIDPDEIDLPGIFVQRVVSVPAGRAKPIERRTLRRSSVDAPAGRPNMVRRCTDGPHD